MQLSARVWFEAHPASASRPLLLFAQISEFELERGDFLRVQELFVETVQGRDQAPTVHFALGHPRLPALENGANLAVFEIARTLHDAEGVGPRLTSTHGVSLLAKLEQTLFQGLYVPFELLFDAHMLGSILAQLQHCNCYSGGNNSPRTTRATRAAATISPPSKAKSS